MMCSIFNHFCESVEVPIGLPEDYYSDLSVPIPNGYTLLTELEVHTRKYFSYGPKSRLIRALLYTCTNKIVYDEILLS